MNMTHDEMIAVIKAHGEGKTIERNMGIGWFECTPDWDFSIYEFRIKPAEPVKRKLCAWVCKKSGGLIYRYPNITVEEEHYHRIPELDKEITLPVEV